LLLSITNKNVLFFIDSLTFGIAAILTFWIKTNLSAQGENKKISVLDSLNSGFKLIIRKQHLAYLLWLDIIISIVSSSINISSLLFIQLKFGQQVGEVFYSLSVMLISIGLAVGSLVIGFFDKVSYRRYFALGGLLLQGISYLILYFVSNSALIAVLFFASGLGASGGLIPLSACYSDWTQEEIRGRVYSLVNSLKRLSAVVAYLVVGYLIELISAIHVILITGILMNIGVLVITIYFNGWKLFNMKNEDN
jgi:MFS transporter, DHA3 family, macrolide efflux protein